MTVGHGVHLRASSAPPACHTKRGKEELSGLSFSSAPNFAPTSVGSGSAYVLSLTSWNSVKFFLSPVKADPLLELPGKVRGISCHKVSSDMIYTFFVEFQSSHSAYRQITAAFWGPYSASSSFLNLL